MLKNELFSGKKLRKNTVLERHYGTLTS